MLAAVPSERGRALELFGLALSMVEAEKSDIPEALKAYFDHVLWQARQLLANPDASVDKLRPEAVQLALDLRDNHELSAAIGDAASINALRKEQAHAVLVAMESLVAA
jgi:hypothetical protein